MKKVIAIGQSVLDIIHLDGRPTASFTGGRIANMAASLGRCGIDVEYVSECATDSVGDMVVDFLNRNGVGTASVDRFTEGQSQVSLIFRTSDGAERYSEYVNYPSSRFDVLWPRIDEGDIVVFGSYFAIDDNPRRGLLELLNYAQQRKAIIVYLPGFQPQLCPRITRVMPAILENLELADIVIARQSDMEKIFGKSDSTQVYKDHILFYCPNFIFMDSNNHIDVHTPSGYISAALSAAENNRLGKDASFAAGIVYGLLKEDVLLSSVNSLSADAWKRIVDTATDFAADSIRSGENVITPAFARSL